LGIWVLTTAEVSIPNIQYPDTLNARGVHAYEKVGFVHEGRFREADWRHGRWQDTLFMSILRHEWRK
jgi:RimJ/RimL family protein N-acetyltransferase